MSNFSHLGTLAAAGQANPPNGLAITLLRRCFLDEEWEQLLANEEFKDALPEIQDLDQVERLVQFGADILLCEWWKEVHCR